uniref:Lipoprotein n=1 Tax=Rheinheimera sp. BAL341 TaxID=1708203 RepID=A0A486XH21_9GAMM
MASIVKNILICIFTLGLVGCAVSPSERMAQYQAGSKLAYISLMGDSFDLVMTGTTIFNNDAKSIDVPEWNFDQKIQDEIIRSSKDSKFIFQNLSNVDKSKLDNVLKGIQKPDTLLIDAKNQGFALLVVFIPEYQSYVNGNRSGNTISVTQNVQGYGLSKISNLGTEQMTFLFSSGKTIIYDLTTSKEIGSVKTVGMRHSNVLHNTKFEHLTRNHIEKEKDLLFDIVTLQAKNHIRDLRVCNCW